MQEVKDRVKQYLAMIKKPYVATELLDGEPYTAVVDSINYFGVVHHGACYIHSVYDYGFMDFSELHQYLREAGIQAVPILDISTDPVGESVFGGPRKGIVINPASGSERLKILNQEYAP